MASRRKKLKNMLLFYKSELDEVNQSNRKLQAGFLAGQRVLNLIINYAEPKFPNLTRIFKNMRASTEGRTARLAFKEITQRESLHRNETEAAKSLVKEMRAIKASAEKLVSQTEVRTSTRALAAQNVALRSEIALLKAKLNI